MLFSWINLKVNATYDVLEGSSTLGDLDHGMRLGDTAVGTFTIPVTRALAENQSC
jgi:hypothetical protein